MSEAKSSRTRCECSRPAVKNGKCAFCLRAENNRTKTRAIAGRRRAPVTGLPEYRVALFGLSVGKTPGGCLA